MNVIWERAELKTRAKAVLKKWYWYIFLATTILAVIGGGANSSAVGVQTYNVSETQQTYTQMVGEYGTEAVILGIAMVGIMALVAVLAGIAISIFLFSPLIVGCKRFIIRLRGDDKNFSYITSVFESGQYKNVVKVSFMKNLYIFLWTLVFIIPGIVKSYEYLMVDYILAENPHIEYKDALRLSRDMMYGHKMNAFILELSFIGWNILGILAFGIGVLFVNPYVEATFIELYFQLKEGMITRSWAEPSEFGQGPEIE